MAARRCHEFVSFERHARKSGSTIGGGCWIAAFASIIGPFMSGPQVSGSCWRRQQDRGVRCDHRIVGLHGGMQIRTLFGRLSHQQFQTGMPPAMRSIRRRADVRGIGLADAGRQRPPMRLFNSELLASEFESLDTGADSGFAESSATRIQRGSANAPGLSITAGLFEAVDVACDRAKPSLATGSTSERRASRQSKWPPSQSTKDGTRSEQREPRNRGSQLPASQLPTTIAGRTSSGAKRHVFLRTEPRLQIRLPEWNRLILRRRSKSSYLPGAAFAAGGATAGLAAAGAAGFAGSVSNESSLPAPGVFSGAGRGLAPPDPRPKPPPSRRPLWRFDFSRSRNPPRSHRRPTSAKPSSSRRSRRTADSSCHRRQTRLPSVHDPKRTTGS